MKNKLILLSAMCILSLSSCNSTPAKESESINNSENQSVSSAEENKSESQASVNEEASNSVEASNDVSEESSIPSPSLSEEETVSPSEEESATPSEDVSESTSENESEESVSESSQEDVGLRSEKNFVISELEAHYNEIDLSLYSPNGQKQIKDLLDSEIEYVNSLTTSLDVRAYDYTKRFDNVVKKVTLLADLITEDVFISEFYNITYNDTTNPDPNSNNNKAIELYNPLDHNVDLTGYTIKSYSNGSDTVKSKDYIISLDGKTIESGKTFTITNSYSKEAFQSIGDFATKVFIGAKSAVGLYKDDELIDVFGTIGMEYATNYDFVINGVEAAADMHNVIRNPGYTGCKEFIEEQWTCHFDNDYSSLGYHRYSTSLVDEAKIALEDYVKEYSNTEINGDINLPTTYHGFDFSFDFVAASYYYDENGKLINEPDEADFPIYVYVSVLDEEGKVIDTNYYFVLIYNK